MILCCFIASWEFMAALAASLHYGVMMLFIMALVITLHILIVLRSVPTSAWKVSDTLYQKALHIKTVVCCIFYIPLISCVQTQGAVTYSKYYTDIQYRAMLKWDTVRAFDSTLTWKMKQTLVRILSLCYAVCFNPSNNICVCVVWWMVVWFCALCGSIWAYIFPLSMENFPLHAPELFDFKSRRSKSGWLWPKPSM